MEIELTKFVRKPFYVEGVLVTADNIEGVAEWCKGDVIVECHDTHKYIKVRVARALHERQTKAYPGDWVLFAGKGFKVYTDKAFRQNFQEVTGEARDAAIQAEKKQPEELYTTNEPVITRLPEELSPQREEDALEDLDFELDTESGLDPEPEAEYVDDRPLNPGLEKLNSEEA